MNTRTLLLVGFGLLVAQPALACGGIEICHVPPGDPGAAHTVEVGWWGAYYHLHHHSGDYLGECAIVDPCDGVQVQSHDCECEVIELSKGTETVMQLHIEVSVGATPSVTGDFVALDPGEDLCLTGNTPDVTAYDDCTLDADVDAV